MMTSSLHNANLTENPLGKVDVHVEYEDSHVASFDEEIIDSQRISVSREFPGYYGNLWEEIYHHFLAL